MHEENTSSDPLLAVFSDREGMGAVRGEEEGREDEEQAALVPGLHLPVTACLGGELCRIIW